MTAVERAPALSVCIPTYNGRDYLGEAMESVLAQTFEDFELLICDDASTDDTPDLVATFGDPRVRYMRFDQNLGQSGNFNRCIEHARGDLWTLLSADDRLLPLFLERAHDALGQYPEVGFFVSAYRGIDAAGNHIGDSRGWPVERLVKPGEMLTDMLQGAYFNTLGLVLRATSLARLGTFRDDLGWGHDWDWVLRLVAQDGGAYTPETLAEYRVHDASGTAEALQAGTNGAAELVILREALGRSPEDIRAEARQKALRAFAIRQLYFAASAMESGSPSAGLMNLRHGVAASPWVMSRATFWKLLSQGLIGAARARRPTAKSEL